MIRYSTIKVHSFRQIRPHHIYHEYILKKRLHKYRKFKIVYKMIEIGGQYIKVSHTELPDIGKNEVSTNRA